MFVFQAVFFYFTQDRRLDKTTLKQRCKTTRRRAPRNHLRANRNKDKTGKIERFSRRFKRLRFEIALAIFQTAQFLSAQTLYFAQFNALRFRYFY